MKRIGEALLIALVLIATGCTQYQYIPVPPGIFDNWEDDNEVVELVITETVTVELNGTVPATVAAIATYEDGTTEEVDAEIISYVNTATVGVHSAYAAYENKMVDIDVYVYDEENMVDSSDNLSTALTTANEGEIIVLSGEITAPTAAINISADNVKIIGDGTAKVTIPTANTILTITGENALIEGVDFAATAITGTTDMINVQSKGVHINNCTFTSSFDLTDNPDVISRGFSLSGSVADIVIENCSFVDMRQPAYVERNVTGTIKNCTISGTRGWVISSGSNLKFENNTFNNNLVDIAIIDTDNGSTQPIPDNYAKDTCIKISNNNFGCFVEHKVNEFSIKNGIEVEYEGL